MQFAEPYYLILLWLVPAIAGFYLFSFRRRTQALRMFAQDEMARRLVPSISRHRQRLKAALLSTAVVFLLLALLRPQWGFHWEDITRRGVDIYVAVDVSQSMMAQDVKPNRLENARRELKDLVARLEGDRIGLIAFAGTAFVQCPLTLDYGAFQLFLEYLRPDLIPVPGTSLGDAIRLAKESFMEQSSTSKALIIITDGEDHQGDPVGAAQEANGAGIQIYTIGVGADAGAPIPSPDGSGFIKNRQGELEMTRLDETTLERIAVETGGAYVRSTGGDMDLDRIYSDGIKKSLKDTELKSSRQKRWEERFQWPLLIAVLMLLLEGVISERARRALVLGLFAMLVASAAPARAGFFGDDRIQDGLDAYSAGDYDTALARFTDAKIDMPDDTLLDYNVGSTYYKLERYDEARTSLERVVSRSPDQQLREKALYNLGNTAFRQGKLDDAVKYYESSLELDPNDADAKRNLEKTRAEIQRRMEEQKQRQQQQQQQQNQQQQSPSDGQQEQGEQGQGQDATESEPPQQASSQQDKAGETEAKSDQKQQEEQNQGATPRDEQPPGTPEPGSQGQGGADGQTPGPDKGAGRPANPAGAEQESKDGDVIQPGTLSPEDAQRILNQVKDMQGAAIPSRQAKQRGAANGAPGGKPW